jgi:hypothetical protein
MQTKNQSVGRATAKGPQTTQQPGVTAYGGDAEPSGSFIRSFTKRLKLAEPQFGFGIRTCT